MRTILPPALKGIKVGHAFAAILIAHKFKPFKNNLLVAYTAANALANTPFAHLAHKTGANKLMCAVNAVLAIHIALQPLLPTQTQQIASTLLFLNFGIANAANQPCQLWTIVRFIPYEERGTACGIADAGTPLGAVAALLYLTYFPDDFLGFSVFGVAAVVLTVCILPLALFIESTPAQQSRRKFVRMSVNELETILTSRPDPLPPARALFLKSAASRSFIAAALNHFVYEACLIICLGWMLALCASMPFDNEHRVFIRPPFSPPCVAAIVAFGSTIISGIASDFLEQRCDFHPTSLRRLVNVAGMGTMGASILYLGFVSILQQRDQSVGEDSLILLIIAIGVGALAPSSGFGMSFLDVSQRHGHLLLALSRTIASFGAIGASFTAMYAGIEWPYLGIGCSACVLTATIVFAALGQSVNDDGDVGPGNLFHYERQRKLLDDELDDGDEPEARNLPSNSNAPTRLIFTSSGYSSSDGPTPSVADPRPRSTSPAHFSGGEFGEPPTTPKSRQQRARSPRELSPPDLSPLLMPASPLIRTPSPNSGSETRSRVNSWSSVYVTPIKEVRASSSARDGPRRGSGVRRVLNQTSDPDERG